MKNRLYQLTGIEHTAGDGDDGHAVDNRGEDGLSVDLEGDDSLADGYAEGIRYLSDDGFHLRETHKGAGDADKGGRRREASVWPEATAEETPSR